MLAMDRATKGWIVNTARANYWRVCTWYELDDLIQDGYLQYVRVATRYEYVTERRHLMALFKRTYMGWIHDLANKRTRQPTILVLDLIPDPPTPEWATFAIRLAQAPEPIKKVLQLFNAHDLRSLRSALRVRFDRRNETLNERLCRLAELTPGTDVIGMFRRYFAP